LLNKINKMKQKIELTPIQIGRLQVLWFVYGNGGRKSTKGNHSYIQGFIEFGEDRKEFYLDGVKNMRENGLSEEKIKSYELTTECINAVETILNQ